MSESKELITAEEVQRSILNRIMMGLYESGERLPSVRDLASELGSNRNTVNKAYQSLVGLGVIEAGDSSRDGFRVIGLADIEAHRRSPFLDYFYRQVAKLVWEGMAAGLSADEVLQTSTRAVQDVYKTGAVRLAFYECNDLDSRVMGKYLGDALETEVACGVLKDFQKRSAHLVRDFDLIITTFHHLAEVIHSTPESVDKVVGIDTRLTSETLLDIARLKGQLGIVCGVQATSHMLEHVLHGYYPTLDLKAVTLEETPRVLELAAASDHLLATHTCVKEVEELTGRSVDVVVNFQVDEQSVNYLKQRIQKVQASKLSAPATLDLLRKDSGAKEVNAPGLGRRG